MKGSDLLLTIQRVFQLDFSRNRLTVRTPVLGTCWVLIPNGEPRKGDRKMGLDEAPLKKSKKLKSADLHARAQRAPNRNPKPTSFQERPCATACDVMFGVFFEFVLSFFDFSWGFLDQMGVPQDFRATSSARRVLFFSGCARSLQISCELGIAARCWLGSRIQIRTHF